MNTKYLVIVAAMTAMLIGATALATDSAFADKRNTMTRTRQPVRPMRVEMVNYR
jgi:hypothetical protein